MGVVTNVVTWSGMGERKTANSLRISGLMWCHQESNRGHKDFQSFALPTELWHLPFNFFCFAWGLFPVCDAKLGIISDSAKCFWDFFITFLWDNL